MASIDLSTDVFEETVLDNDIVFVDFWAEWCGPCKSFAPIYENAATEHDDITFAKVDIEAEPALYSGLGIQGVPTIMAFREGVLVFRQTGAFPAEVLDDLVSQVKGLDMDVVHAEIAAHEAKAEAEATKAEAADSGEVVDLEEEASIDVTEGDAEAEHVHSESCNH